jgi:hypothetical protein
MRQPDESDWDEFHDPEIVDWKRVRSSIEHENTLTNHRFTWLLTSQGFLFGAFALAFQASTSHNPTGDTRSLYQYIMSGLAFTGIMASGYHSLGLLAAHQQHQRLEQWWRERPKEDPSRHPPICGTAPRLFFYLPYHSFPFVFVVAWVFFVLVALENVIRPYVKPVGVVLLVGVALLGVLFIGYWLGQRRAASRP